MRLSSLLYVSHSRIPDNVAQSSVQQLVDASVLRNRGLGITGALLFTGRHFAQVIEGDRSSVDLLWADIQKDIRHEKIAVVERVPIAARRFADWSLAFFGPSELVTRQVESLSHLRSEAHYRRAAEWLNDLLRQTWGRDASGKELGQDGGAPSLTGQEG